MDRYFVREKRILLLMREYVLGGAETQFRYLIEYAERCGWKLDVLIEHDLNQGSNELKRAMPGMNSVRLYELNGGRENGKLYIAVMRHIFRNLSHIKYTSCLVYHPSDLVMASFMRTLGIRFIYSERQNADTIVKDRYLQKCLRSCDIIIANSRHAQKQLEILTGKKVRFIRNGKPAVKQLPLKERGASCRILIPARIDPIKNQMLPLQYLKKHQNFNGKFVFVGLEENKAYCGKLKQFARRNGIWDKVEFLGHVNDMEPEYRKADLILLPSFAEGTPNVVLEAYAYGRPVIVSDINVEREIVPDSKLRFSVKDPVGIGECIQYIQEMPDETYRQLIEKNRKFVLQNYSIEKMAERFYRILSKSQR